MLSPQRLATLLLVLGLAGSALAALSCISSTRVAHQESVRARVNLVADIVAARLGKAVLHHDASTAQTVLDEFLSTTPVAAAYVLGLDGSIFAAWSNNGPASVAVSDYDASRGLLGYPITTGRRPIGLLEIRLRTSTAPLPPPLTLLQSGLPLLIAMIGCVMLTRSRPSRADSDDTQAQCVDLKSQLTDARLALDTASRAKSLFLANMSHEIRTPLNGVLGMADLLLGTRLDERQRTFATTVRNSAESLLNIVNDLLDFSRIESGNLHLEKLDFSPRECVEDVVQLLGAQAHSKRIELVCEIDTDLPERVRSDPARLRQILVNLVGNAIKFTDSGEVVVRVGVSKGSAGHVRCCIEVSDTGIGIAPQMQRKIFDVFTQVDASTTRRHGGAGLGLAISRQLVELMGGTITLRSQPGNGTTFTVEVELETVADAASRDMNLLGQAVRSLRVLIVDDNETNRLVLSNQLDSWGIVYQAVSTGTEALETLREADDAGHSFSIAILDMQMPEMDGLALAARIKADPKLAPTRLMLLTSAVVDLTAEQLREAGFAQFTNKPVRQSQLYNCLLYLASDEAQGKQIAAEPVQPAAGAGHRFDSDVLLVEDNAVNQEVARHMLESLGCQVHLAENGRAALEKLEHASFDLILMDCQMPVMDGFETTEAVRERERTEGRTAPHPIIALTANALSGDREQCLAAGMDDYVSKPFKLDELERVLSRWLPAEHTKPTGRVAPQRGKGAAASDAEVEMLDARAIDALRSIQRPGKPDLVAKVVRLYLDRSPDALQEIARAVAARDARALQGAAHSLKSSSANLGATQVAECARTLERHGREGDLTQSDAIVAQLNKAYPPTAAQLERYLPQGADGPVALQLDR